MRTEPKNEMRTECSSASGRCLWAIVAGKAHIADLETEVEGLRAELAEKDRKINEVFHEQVRHLHGQRDELMGRLYPNGESLEERVKVLERMVDPDVYRIVKARKRSSTRCSVTTKKTYLYEGWADALEFAETLGFKSLEQAEQEAAASHGVASYDDVPEHYRCGLIDEREADALEYIRAKGFEIRDS